MNDTQAVRVLKALVMDQVHKANSGHTGGAMSSADFAYTLFARFLRLDPANPAWPGRDRFILSAGHESALMYSLLHSVGYLPMDELKRFRQWHSKTPGHPENTATPGVECTTGPLGQGAAMSVGFAIAAARLRQRFGEDLFSQKIHVLMGDGCVQEDVAISAASIAGHLRLDNLIWFYDKNDCQISGHVTRAFSTDVAKLFEAMGWRVLSVDGHNLAQLQQALATARVPSGKPTLIIGTTVMAKGCATMEDSHETHGVPLPADEIKRTKTAWGLPPEESFHVPTEYLDAFRHRYADLSAEVNAWNARLAEKMADPAFAREWNECFSRSEFGDLPRVPWAAGKEVPTRTAFGDIIAHWADALPAFMGGSADLEPSVMTGKFAAKVKDFTAENRDGRNIAFGVKEFPMAAIANGMALHGGVIPFTATFLTFSDYSRPALRLGAIQRIRVIHEFTHDSFHVGEDGPTHQPVEHLMALRHIPGLYVIRPADARETEVLLRKAMTLHAPTAFCLSRQKLPLVDLPEEELANAARGAYVVHDCPGFDTIIIATGSEVSVALGVARQLPERKIRVVSMPCWELYTEQPRAYQESVLPSSCQRRVSIEAGTTLGWERHVQGGLMIGRDDYGHSAPAEKLAEEYGFTADAIAKKLAAHVW